MQFKLDLAQMRSDKNIPYGNNFLNDAIDVRINTVGMDRNLNEPNMSYQDKVSKQKMIEESEIAKYILETKQDVEKQASLRGILLNVFDEYSIFIIIFIIMIAGGIVSSEFEKGTVKMLLVKPYKRGKILLAKYIVSLLMILFIFVITVVFQVIVGGVVFGFDSLSIPAVVYNFNTNSVVTYNMFEYVLIIAVNKLPIYVLLTTLSFALSSIFANTVIAVVLPILGNVASAVINQLASVYSIRELAVFPTLNWDFSQFLFGRLPAYEFTSLGFAVCVCVVYWAIMVSVAWIAFRKREIKNV
nr:ABC transporter permease [Clostridia bacterium]